MGQYEMGDGPRERGEGQRELGSEGGEVVGRGAKRVGASTRARFFVQQTSRTQSWVIPRLAVLSLVPGPLVLQQPTRLGHSQQGRTSLEPLLATRVNQPLVLVARRALAAQLTPSQQERQGPALGRAPLAHLIRSRLPAFAAVSRVATVPIEVALVLVVCQAVGANSKTDHIDLGV